MGLTTVVSLATIAAGLASVGSLLAVAWQLKSLARQTSEAAKQAKSSAQAIQASVYLTTQEKAMEIDRLFIDNPDLRARFYGPVPGRGDQSELQRTDATAEMLIDAYDLVIAHREFLPPTLTEGWSAYMDHMMTRSVALRDFWNRNRGWYVVLHEAIGDRWTSEDGPPPAGPSRTP